MSTKTEGAAKLSQMQKDILGFLLEETRRYEAHEAEHPWEGLPGLAYHVSIWGVRWPGGEGRIQSTSFSRALARLEARGLLLRQNKSSGSPGRGRARTNREQAPPLRCISVLLTAGGRAVAESLEEANG